MDYCRVSKIQWKNQLTEALKQKNSLDALCDRLNIDRSSRNKGHGADIDTELLKQVYEKLLIDS